MSTVDGCRVVVAAVGAELHRDDAAGPAVLRRLGDDLEAVEVLGAVASPLQLLGLWDCADLAIVVDAVAGDGEPGAVHVIEVDLTAPPRASGRTASSASSHGFGVVEALRIACALGTAPARVVLVGVVGEDFGDGAGLSPSVSRAVERAAHTVTELAGAALAAARPEGGVSALANGSSMRWDRGDLSDR